MMMALFFNLNQKYLMNELTFL
jgi:hypothetical protein